MSASERLRALMAEEAIIVVSVDPTPLHVAGEPTTASVTLRNALPLIADVVEAAEAFCPAPASMVELHPLCSALSALSEHLEGQ